MTRLLNSMIADGQIVQWTREFVRYPSPQTARFEAEPAVLEFIQACMVPLIKTLELPHRTDAMGNLIVELGPPDTDTSLILMAYAMCHPAASMQNPYEAEIVDGEAGQAIRGRGVAEQKGSLAAALAAALAAHRCGKLKGRLALVVSTAGETGRHDAAISILDALGYTPKLGVVVIGSNNKPTLGNKGRIDIEISVRGKAGHSSTPWLGIDAIAGATQVLNRLETMDLGTAEHPQLGRATLTPTAIHSYPQATHTVQNEVQMVYDRRLLPGQQVEMAMQQVKNAVGGIAPCDLDICPGAFMYPGEIESDGLLMHHIRSGYRLAGLESPAAFYSHGCLDAGYLIHNGCEATMWGPGDMRLWHSDNETLPIDDLLAGADAYFGFISSYLT